MTASSLPQGTRIADRYVIDREVGAGGMATVYIAEDQRLRRRVAIKLLKPELALSVGPARFLREIEIAAHLQDPHILAVYDAGEFDGTLFYVMPFVDGESLRDRIDRNGELPVHEAVRIARAIASALATAHAAGVVHRDIKPDNVLLTGDQVLVMDFGIARAVSEGADESQITTVGMAVGTPAYMAPEQAVADPQVDRRADLYALGATIYELLAGDPPFTGRTSQEVLAAHVTRTPQPIGERRPATPPLLASLVMRCLEKRPADRIQTAAEIVTLLASPDVTAGVVPPVPTSSGAAAEVQDATRRTTPPASASGRASASRSGSRRRRIGAVLAVALLAVAFAGWRLSVVGAAGTMIGNDDLAADDQLLVADFTNETSDSSLASAVTDAIRVELLQSNVVRVLGQAEMWDAMRRMELAPGTLLTDSTARELAQREGAKGYVVGAVRRLGNGYQLTARVLATADGRELRVARTTARNDDELISAVEELGQQLRTDIGESLRSVRASPPLARVTTASLPALRAYARGIRLSNLGERDAAVAAYLEAVGIDTAFASAWASLGSFYYNSGQPDRARAARERAFQHRDRLTETGRLSVQASYHRQRGERAQAEAAYRELVAGGRSFTNYSDFLLVERRFAEAESMALIATERSPKSLASTINVLEAQLALRRFDALQAFVTRMYDSLENRPMATLFHAVTLFARREFDSLPPLLEGGAIPRQPRQFFACRRLVYDGRYAEAATCVSPEERLRILMDTTAAHAALDSALAGDVEASRRSGDYRRLISLAAEAGRLDDARALLTEWRTRFGPDDPEYRTDHFAAEGAIARARGDYAAARDAYLAWNSADFNDANHNFVRGLPEAANAYDRLGEPDSAIALFERALATPVLSPEIWEYYDALWYVPSLRRLGELYEARGDREPAARAYAAFVERWRNGDARLQPEVQQVRQRLERLRGEQPTPR